MTISLTQRVERDMAARRVKEAKHVDLTNFARNQTRQASENRGHQLAAAKGRRNKNLVLAGESMLNMTDSISREQVRIQERDRQQNSALAAVLQKQRNDEQRSELEVQRICEGSEELKELESRLKVAYMNKERAQQIEEGAMIKEADRMLEQRMDDQMELNRQHALYESKVLEETRRKQNENAKAELEEQMAIQHYENMIAAKLSAEKDKDMVADVIRKIEQEDFREHCVRQNKVQDTISAIEAYKIQRKDMLAEEARMLKAEEDKILAYAMAKGAREATILKAKDEKRLQEEETFKAIEAQMKAQRLEREEFQQLRDSLWAEETEHRLHEQEMAKQKARDDSKLEMKQANELQKRLKQQIRIKQKEEDDQLSALMKDKFARDKRMDQEAEQRRAENQLVYKSKIEAEHEDKRRRYKQEKDREEHQRMREEQEVAYKKRVIEAARQRLLQGHAQALSSFLPKGVLQKPDDLKLLAQFDTDGNGTLDQTEINAAQKSFMKFDADGNGTLDSTERSTAFESLRQGRGEGFA
jgi:hypothetical protein